MEHDMTSSGAIPNFLTVAWKVVAGQLGESFCANRNHQVSMLSLQHQETQNLHPNNN
jgi:hypothetical protein